MHTTTISDAHDVVEKVITLHNLDLPPQLIGGGDVERLGNFFDPNQYLTVLKHIVLIPGHTLDYVYGGGHPRLYARPIGTQPFQSTAEYLCWKKTHSLLDYLMADGSPQGYFELVVFLRLAGQFYLYWHSNYNDLRMLTTRTDIQALISQTNQREPGAPPRDVQNCGPYRLTYDECLDNGIPFNDEQIVSMGAVDPQPVVKIYDTRASVTYCTFTKWGGLSLLKEYFRRTAPHCSECKEILARVPYHCGIDY